MKAAKEQANGAVSAPRLWVVLARAYGSLAAYVEQRVTAEGLCLSDFMVLEVLLHKGPLTISAIGEKVLLANASMTSAIDRLDARGFVTRNESATDRRIRIIELTPNGQTFIAAMYERHAQDIEAVMHGVSAAERLQLYRGLKKLGLSAHELSAAGPSAHRASAVPVAVAAKGRSAAPTGGTRTLTRGASSSTAQTRGRTKTV